MDITNLVETNGIILFEKKYKESSKILDIFTESLGRINLFANGVLKPKSGLMLATEKFVESSFIFNLSNGSYFIKSADIINSNMEVSKDLKSYFLAELICEVISKTMPENLVDEKIYQLSTASFKYIRQGQIDIKLLKLGFLLKFTSLLGYKPNLNTCGKCGTKNMDNMYFSYNQGGLICGNFLDFNTESIKVSKEEIEYLWQILFSKYSDYEKINIENIIIKKLDIIIMKYFMYNTELNELDSQKKYNKFFEI